jgi:hypothetical protein
LEEKNEDLYQEGYGDVEGVISFVIKLHTQIRCKLCDEKFTWFQAKWVNDDNIYHANLPAGATFVELQQLDNTSLHNFDLRKIKKIRRGGKGNKKVFF